MSQKRAKQKYSNYQLKMNWHLNSTESSILHSAYIEFCGQRATIGIVKIWGQSTAERKIILFSNKY